MKTKKCSKCDRLSFSKGLCKIHQKKKPIKTKPKVVNKGRVDYNTEDFDKLSISDLKKIADYWLRQYLLNQSSGFGDRIWCPIKKQTYHKDKIHVAHFIDRANMCLRYSLDNCHLISEESNSWDAQIPFEGYKSKHHKEYEDYLISKCGADKVNELKQKSLSLCLLYKEDYIKIIKEFKNGTEK